MTLRPILWGLVVVLVLGSVWQFLRALRLGRAPMTACRSAAAAEPGAMPAGRGTAESGDDAAGADDDEDGFDYAPRLRPVSATIATLPEQVVPAQPARVPTPAVPVPEVFQLELEVRHLQRELERQQELVADEWSVRIAGHEAHEGALREIGVSAASFDIFLGQDFFVIISTEGGVYSPEHLAALSFTPTYSEEQWGPRLRDMYAFLEQQGDMLAMCPWTFSDEGAPEEWHNCGWYRVNGSARSPVAALRE